LRLLPVRTFRTSAFGSGHREAAIDFTALKSPSIWIKRDIGSYSAKAHSNKRYKGLYFYA
jgi:hypothetical protein